MVGFVLSLEGNTGFQRGKDVIMEEEVLAPGGWGGEGRSQGSSQGFQIGVNCQVRGEAGRWGNKATSYPSYTLVYSQRLLPSLPSPLFWLLSVQPQHFNYGVKHFPPRKTMKTFK